MENNQFEQLMQELRQSRQEIDGKLTAFKWEVHIAQEKTAKELARKFNVGSSGKKGTKCLNSEVEESTDSAKKVLERMASSSLDSKAKESLNRATDHFEEGASVIKTHQKHIKVADRSNHGWGAVWHYQSDPLAENSDDEKELRRADKEAKKEFGQLESWYNRRPRGGGSWSNRRGRRH